MNPLKLVITPTRSRRLNELIGLLVLVAATLLLLSLISYRSSDPSWNTVAPAAGQHWSGHNWTGRIGAYAADLLLQFFGTTAFLLPLLVGALGWSWLRSRAASSPAVRILGAGLMLVFLPAACALLPTHPRVLGLPVEGLSGRLLADSLVAQLNYPGACVLTVSLVAIALYFATTFSIASLRKQAAVRFAFVQAWRDRWENWKQRRTRRKLEHEAACEVGEREKNLLRARQLLEEQESRLAGLRRFWQKKPRPMADDDEAVPPRRASFVETAAVAATPLPISTRPAVPYPEPEVEPAPASPELAVGPRPVSRFTPTTQPEAVAGSAEKEIAFTQRADIDIRTVTLTQKTIHGYSTRYKLPPSTLLHRSEDNHVVREEELRAEATVLVEKCAEFGVGGQVVQINPGPVVTTFEFRPDSGVKYSRVTGLADDLCLAMAAESILIERMAGKSTVGIQVPNADRETIWLRDVIEAESFATSKSKITIAMGKDINGRIVSTDLAAMPHVLIAGSTGSGKSVAINAMIMSVLYKSTPEQVRLILVDPKRVELGMYEGIPHLFTPIITDPKLAANALKNAVREMERRLKLLASRSVRNIDQYNKLFVDGPGLFDDDNVEQAPLPYIMIIIDELADLMMLDRANVEEAITRLAQMARAVGIHLVLATQRPSVDVITGLIKANVPTRISFRLASKTDSRTILDSNGAESLLGRGDMLFLPPGTSRVQRVHAPFVTEAEISGVVAFWKAQGEADYVEGFLDSPKDDKGRDLEAEPGAEDENDELYDDAVRLVFEFGKASTSLLQRRMRIGYGRAAHLIDLMERDGLVGPPEGSKPREILKNPDWLSEIDSAMR
jgi:S-DNA-T family DNA segregation ATPase FtsK/SpoIIIE